MKRVLLRFPILPRSIAWARAEAVAARGLALASVGRLAEARAIAGDAIAATRAIEVRVIAPAIEAICCVKERSTGMKDAIQSLLQTGTDSGAVDLIVTAYRGNGDLLEEMLASRTTRERAVHIMMRAGDTDLLDASGLDPIAIHDPVGSLLGAKQRCTSCYVMAWETGRSPVDSSSQKAR